MYYLKHVSDRLIVTSMLYCDYIYVSTVYVLYTYRQCYTCFGIHTDLILDLFQWNVCGMVIDTTLKWDNNGVIIVLLLNAVYLFLSYSSTISRQTIA